MEYIKKILEHYRDFASRLHQEFADHSHKCPFKVNYKCIHGDGTKRAWKDYSVDTRCTLDNCPL